ncbi:hypothetical protein [Blastopirellula marina]|uniref:Tetratricopeptide repeat protein n=1 Tax=Blastopirellula marina TaxID=124 RepID=A0A2S8GGX9_9BACT|nr:hypothetical protein [Blastopirellula marina]PQO43725.1 hypothetical protein C5Y93_24135 [Blastopirellula marina]
MSDYDAGRVWDLLRQASSLPHGEVQVRLTEEAVNLAETGRDLDLMFAARQKLVGNAVYSGRLEKALPAFAWCLSHLEREPERFSRYKFHLLWEFKNILHNVDEFPQLSNDQISALRDQMANLYRQSGYNMRPVHYTSLTFAMRSGHFAEAAESFAKYRELGRDSVADCLACEADSDAEYYMLVGENEQAVEAGGPTLRRQLICTEVPHRTYCNMLRPLALQGRYEEADEYQRKGYRLVRNKVIFLAHLGWQLAYQAHRDRLSSALRMFEVNLGIALDTFNLRSRYLFFLAARRVLALAAEKKTSQKLNLPQSFPLYSPTEKYDLAELLNWLDAENARVAAQFDARNGNVYHSQDLAQFVNY